MESQFGLTSRKLRLLGPWPGQIAEAIASCKVLIVGISRKSVISGNVLREVSLATEYAKPILPLILETTDIPVHFQFQLAGIQRLNYAAGEPDQTMPEILRSLKRFEVEFQVQAASRSFTQRLFGGDNTAIKLVESR